MGRKDKKIVLSAEQKAEKKKLYHQQYYNEFKKENLSQTVINNAIERLMRNDKYLEQLIVQVGYEKMNALMGQETF